MPLFEWSDNLSVGVREMDNQHKHLIDIINELNDATEKGDSGNVLSGIFDRLIDYTKFHFGNEETLMKDTGYTGLFYQQHEHKKLIEEIEDLQKHFHDGSATVNDKTMNFLKSWLYDHILGTDQKYTSHFNSKGIS